MALLIGLLSTVLAALLESWLKQRQAKADAEELARLKLDLAAAQRMKEAYAWKARAARNPYAAARLRVRDEAGAIELSDRAPDDRPPA